MRASGESRDLSGSVVGGCGEWRQVAGKRGVVLVEEYDGSREKSELYGNRDLRCRGVVGVDDGLKCLSKQVSDINVNAWWLGGVWLDGVG